MKLFPSDSIPFILLPCISTCTTRPLSTSVKNSEKNYLIISCCRTLRVFKHIVQTNSKDNNYSPHC